MSDKQDTSGEGPAVPDISPQGDGNPFERMRQFRAQRDAVMLPTDGSAGMDAPSSSDGSGSAEDEGAGQAGEHQTAVEEYHRRQSIDRDL